jgi:hypothetical protein
VGEWEGDEDVTDVTIADGVTVIERKAFRGCEGLSNLSFIRGSGVTTIRDHAFRQTGITSLLGVEGVKTVGNDAFSECEDLRTIEGLGCEEMGSCCFYRCRLLQSMKGWPASMTVIPPGMFRGCTGMTTVDCNLSNVTSIGPNAFTGCTSLLPPSMLALAEGSTDPAAVLAYLKRKSFLERNPLRYAVYASIRRARDQEGEPRTHESPTAVAFALAKLPPDMNRVIVEFLLGEVPR